MELLELLMYTIMLSINKDTLTSFIPTTVIFNHRFHTSPIPRAPLAVSGGILVVSSKRHCYHQYIVLADCYCFDKCPDSKPLWEEGIYLPNSLQYIKKGSEGRNSKQKPGGGNRSRDYGGMLLIALLQWLALLPFLDNPESPAIAWHCSQWAGHSYTKHKSRKHPPHTHPQTCPQAEAASQSRLLLLSLGYIKLVKPSQHTNRCQDTV